MTNAPPTLKHAVIHKLLKERAFASEIQSAEQALDAQDENVEKLITMVVKLIGKPGNAVLYGTFRESPDRTGIPDLLIEYGAAAETSQPEQFLELSNHCMTTLKTSADQKPGATGGLVLFAHYYLGDKSYFLAAMISERDGLVVDEKLRPVSIQELNLEKLRHLARISLEDIIKLTPGSKKTNYAAFFNPKRDEVSDYFINCFSCMRTCTAASATKDAIDCVQRWAKSYKKTQKLAIMERVVRRLENARRQDRDVELAELVGEVEVQLIDGGLSEEEAKERCEGLHQIMQSEPYNLSHEFPVAKKPITKYMTFEYRHPEGWLELRISRGALEVFSDRSPVELLENEGFLVKDKGLLDSLAKFLSDGDEDTLDGN